MFHKSTKRICILCHADTHEYLLPKGRRRINESRSEAALREILEETGYRCTTPQMNIPSLLENVDGTNEIRGHGNAFAMTMRWEGPRRLKLIWWFVGEIPGVVLPERGPLEPTFEPILVAYDEAVRLLTFKDDKELVQKAIDIVTPTSLMYM